MDQEHRRILQKNYTFMIENIANPWNVADLLFEKEILTESMKQDIEAEKTTHNKVRKLIDTLPKRGPEAFGKFCEALRKSDNDTVAVALNRTERKGPDPPSNWPNEEAMVAAVQVVPCNDHEHIVRDNWNNEHVYPLRQKKRGRCIIIANKVFNGPLAADEKGNLRVQLTTRNGTEKDEERLHSLFRQLFFEVVLHSEKTAEEMLELLKAEARRKDHKEAECFVCIVCSHGTERGVYGIDGRVLPLIDLTSCMDGENCQALREKPKLFFIQACQGEKADTPQDSIDAGEDLSLMFSEMNMTDGTKDKVVIQAARVPTKADMLIACATHPGYVSLRSTMYGSWFIQAIIYIFQHNAHKEDIFTLLTQVNNLVAKGQTKKEDQGGTNIMQACQYHSSLRKKFYFFPGKTADS